MASYLQIENISKSYGPKVLFENIGFNVNEGDKIALIAPNGTGKTSLLRILAGKDKSDSGGKITFLKDIRIAFLEQEYDFDQDKGIFDQIRDSSKEFIEGLPPESIPDWELRVRKLLTSFGLNDFQLPMSKLSGGEIKRVALTQMLACEADFYIMDEPTNHLDIDAIEFLEDYLSRSRCTLLMVTHDRYFLDHVCNEVMELDRGHIYVYRGGYQNYLEKRQERIDNYNANTDKVRNILRRELEWMRSSPCARTGKAKYRKDAFYELKDRAEDVYVSRQVNLSDMGTGSRLGTKIFNCKDVSFSYGDKCILSHFTYNFQRFERVGIVGGNGVGKTTFISLLTGDLPQDGEGKFSGVIERGESLSIGYYRQSGISFDEDQTVLETVNDTSLLSRFLFPHEMLASKVATLSGGEKRRLYLLTVLMSRPNVLILDEPTNDLDIVTLNVLEEYLKEYKGTLIIISHDRHFLDRLVEHLLVFTGEGNVKDFIGDYSQYRQYMIDLRAEERSREKKLKQAAAKTAPVPQQKKKKLSYKEKKELESLEAELGSLNAEKQEIETALSGGNLPMDKLRAASTRFGELSKLIDEKEIRWLELSELDS